MCNVPAHHRVWTLAVMEATKAEKKKEVERTVVRVSVEVKIGTATFRVAVQSQSIERALRIVKRQNPTKEFCVRVPTDHGPYFAEEERVATLGMPEGA